jgi:hypothetical protein
MSDHDHTGEMEAAGYPAAEEPRRYLGADHAAPGARDQGIAYWDVLEPTVADTYGGISRESPVIPMREKVFVSGGTMRVPIQYVPSFNPSGKIIEGEVVKAQPHERFALDMPSAKPISFDPMPDHRNPDYMMRGFGYFANPETCTHYRKRMTTATLRWRCADCGREF